MTKNNPSCAAALSHAAAQKARYERELIEFLQIPSVSTQPERTRAVAAAADWVHGALEAAGLENAAVIATGRHPLVYADWLHAGADQPTVLFYGHYDVQPEDPVELWATPPFEPVVVDDYIIARGASDDKGQLFLLIKAVEACMQATGGLPINVKFLIEGEEESGGESIAAYVPLNTEKLAADVALVADTAILSKEQPAIVYGLRGLCYVLIDVEGPSRDLHSGSFGGGIDNPLNVLGHIISQLKDRSGHVRIPGFYDNVRPLDDEERALLAELPLNEAAWLAETGAPMPWGEPEYTLVERLGARPTLDVHGIIGGYTGAGGKTVLPAAVHAKLSMRLVPDQDPERIYQLLSDYLQTITPPTVTVHTRLHSSAPASISDYRQPAIRAARTAYGTVFEKEPVLMREGGSIPIVGVFQEHLGIETVLMGFGLPGDRIHSPNERFYRPNLHRGVETVIHFMYDYSALEGER